MIRSGFTNYRFFLLILVLGFALRLVWNPHQIIWSYDQARDSFFMRQMLENKDLILLGPQAEEFGLFHGPLYYYLFAPFYSLSKGEPILPLIVMSVLNLLSAVPLALIAAKITKSKLAGIFTFAIFSFSYAFVEYSRWLSNVSITLPFVAWSYYLLYEILEGRVKKFSFFLLGLFLGLATQGEIFFLSLIVTFFLVLVVQKAKLVKLLNYILGSVVGVLPILIAQFKFNFMGARILTNMVSSQFQNIAEGASVSLIEYVNHLGLTFYQTIGGVSVSMGLVLFILILVLVGKKIGRVWLLAILLGHAFLFTLDYINVVFLDIGFALLLPVLVGVGAYCLYKANRFLFAITVIFYLIFQLGLYKSYLLGRKPFGGYNFIHQTGSTLADYDDIVSKMYELSKGKDFTLSVIGTPFGVRTVWASVFELYTRRSNLPLPKWFEYYAEGYPGDEILAVSRKPGDVHILVLESNIENLLPKPIIDRELGNQDNNTKLVEEFELNGTLVQVRKPI